MTPDLFRSRQIRKTIRMFRDWHSGIIVVSLTFAAQLQIPVSRLPSLSHDKCLLLKRRDKFPTELRFWK